ncbi:MAG: hypothetical protein SW019_14815 [Actinomycetota bacterium]|nr:hypothetical protein [Actinomycetota bacterium]
MRTEPLTIPGVAGSLTVETSVWSGRRRLFVDDAEVPTRFGRFELAGTDGRPRPGQIKPLRFWDTYPRIEVDGALHRTGPEAPGYLKAVAFLPVLLVFIGGVLGALLGFAGVIINFAAIRSRASRTVVIVTSLGTLLLGVVVLFAVAGVVGATLGR